MAEADRGEGVLLVEERTICHHPRKRVTQYSETLVINREAAAYWIPTFAGTTAESEALTLPIALTTSPRLFLLRLLDQFLADHDRRPRHGKNIADAQAIEARDRRRQRQRGGGVAAEIGAELRDQRADALLQKAHRTRGGAGGLGPHANGAGRGVVHHEGVGDHHDHLGAEQPGRRLIGPGDAEGQVQQGAGELQRQPNQISFSANGAARSGRRTGCRPDTQIRWSQTGRRIRRWSGPSASPRCRARRRQR